MLTVDYLLICQDVTFDDSRRASIINIFDTMYIDAVPAGLRDVKLTTRIRPTTKPVVNKETTLTFRLSKDSVEVSTVEIKDTLTIEMGNSFSPVIQVQELIFPEFGNYKIELLINGVQKAENVFSVRDTHDLSEP